MSVQDDRQDGARSDEAIAIQTIGRGDRYPLVDIHSDRYPWTIVWSTMPPHAA